MLIDVNELIPQHIERLYQIILKGGYINENSAKNANAELYDAIVTKEHELKSYFRPLGYALMRREGYYYFARDDASDGEAALELIVDYIDIANFLKTLDSNFDIGYRFSLTSMENQLNTNVELQDLSLKMKGIKSDSHREFIQKIVDKLRKDGFVEERNSVNSEFIVLNSYEYIKSFLDEVEVYE
ncbi:hypothetical protein JHD48_07065 [Sulfurimonas sp. SAG-AH-194-I05]|nr:hypothetical protein [Sulfurimonas sp. SAG-AH-194-I05]MDF1875490.1 hypothetical protein [Sulfurimonas sp. SAG-AH-194-I05]